MLYYRRKLSKHPNNQALDALIGGPSESYGVEEWRKEVTTVDMAGMRSSEPPKERIQSNSHQNGNRSFERTAGPLVKPFGGEGAVVL